MESLKSGSSAGYVDCACRDCFEIAIASADDEVGTVLCQQCRDAGCEAATGACCVEPDLDEYESEEKK